MSIIATMGQYFEIGPIEVSLAVTPNRVSGTSTVQYSIQISLDRISTENLNITVNIANSDGSGGSVSTLIIVQAGFLGGSGAVNESAASSGAFVATVTSPTTLPAGHIFVNLPLTVNVPAAPTGITIAMSPTRNSASSVDLNYTATLDGGATAPGFALVNINSSNTNGAGATASSNFIFNAGDSSAITALNITNAISGTYDVTITAGSVPSGYEFSNLPLTVNVPAALDTSIEASADSIRRSASSHLFTIFMELDDAPANSITVIVTIVNGQNTGDSGTSSITFPAGQKQVVQQSTFSSVSGTGAFTVTMSEHTVPAGYSLTILTPTINVDASTITFNEGTFTYTAARSGSSTVTFDISGSLTTAVTSNTTIRLFILQANSIDDVPVDITFSAGSNTSTAQLVVTDAPTTSFGTSLRQLVFPPGFRDANLPQTVIIPAVT